MKPFNLEEYLANPSRKIVTRDGKKVRIICTDAKSCYPVIALAESHDGTTEQFLTLTKNGKYFDNRSSREDLFFAPEKHEGWMNIYKNERDHYFGKFIYPRRADAEAVADSTCIATAKIEWEE